MIAISGQFHQHFMRKFFYLHVTREKLTKRLAAFGRADPKSAKKTDNLTVFFMILGSAHVKDAHRMMKFFQLKG